MGKNRLPRHRVASTLGEGHAAHSECLEGTTCPFASAVFQNSKSEEWADVAGSPCVKKLRIPTSAGKLTRWPP